MNATQFTCDFNSLSKYLRAFALKLTKDAHLAEDLYQDTALRAFAYRDKFVAATNMKAWLCTIMKNTFINEFRKKKALGEGGHPHLRALFAGRRRPMRLERG